MNYTSFDQVLRDFLIKSEQEGKKKRDNDWWHASSLGLCKRKHFFRRLGLKVTDEKEFRIYFIARDGTAGHEWREKAAESMGVLVSSEESLVSKKYRYKGRLDLIIKLGEKEPYLCLVDIKTQRPEAFFRRERLPEGKRVKDFQKMQLASYFYFARKKYPNLKEARIYYVDRGGGVRNEYVFRFKKKTFDKVLNELKALNKYWKDQIIPPRAKDNKWQCNYCPYREICKKVDKDNLTVKQVLQIYGQGKT